MIAELELERRPRLLVIADLRGCDHAAAFGSMEQPLDEARALITAALAAWERRST